MRRTCSTILLLALACAGCAELNSIALNVSRFLPHEALFGDRKLHTAELQRELHQRKTAIEQRAATGEITWFQAAREIRNLERRSSWTFERADEEYHAYSAAVAEQVDAGRLTYAQYDVLRTQRLQEIQRRRVKQ